MPLISTGNPLTEIMVKRDRALFPESYFRDNELLDNVAVLQYGDDDFDQEADLGPHQPNGDNNHHRPLYEPTIQSNLIRFKHPLDPVITAQCAGHDTNFLLDTGSQCNLLTKDTWYARVPPNKRRLRQSTLTLIGISGIPIQYLGICTELLDIAGVLKETEFFVVDQTDGANIIGTRELQDRHIVILPGRGIHLQDPNDNNW